MICIVIWKEEAYACETDLTGIIHQVSGLFTSFLRLHYAFLDTSQQRIHRKHSMSSQLPSGKEELNSTKAPLPIMLNGKSNAAPPQVSKNEDVELSDIPDAEAKLPLHEDIMQLARLGEIGPIQKLFEGGKFKADHCDEEGITPLHVR